MLRKAPLLDLIDGNSMARIHSLVLLALLASPALGQDLFRYVEPSLQPNSDGSATTSWQVEVDLARLATNPSELVLTLPSSSTLSFQRTESEPRSPGSLAWWGHLDGEPGWSASLTLDGTHLTGVLLTPEGAFELLNDTGSGRRLVEIEDSDPWCRGGVPHPQTLAPPAVAQPSIVGVDAAAFSEITVLALYTQDAMEIRGGAAAIENEIRAAVDFFSGVLRNNGLDGRGQLVHVEKAPSRLFGTTSLDEALDLLRVDPDVAALRQQTRADVVSLYSDVVEAGGASNCGLAFLMVRGDGAASMAPWAFNGINARCSRSVLSHEIGHNLGLNHNPDDTSITPAAAFRSYAFGHRESAGADWFRTMMSYGRHPQLSYFSTPSVTHGGVPIGIADQRDNARTLVESLPIGAMFRTGRGGGPPRPPPPGNVEVTIDSPTSVTVTWSDPVNDETGFSVEHRSDGGAFTSAVVVAADVVLAVVDELEPATTYTFRVRTVRGTSYSNSSNQVTVTMPPAVTAPDTLTASTVSEHEIRLQWTGGSEPTAIVEARTPGGELDDLAILSLADGEATLSGLDADMPHTFRLRLEQDGHTVHSPEASAATTGASGPCVAGPETLCLLDDRFEVEARWRNQRQEDDAGVGQATPVATSDQSGLFQFFDAENIELVVKVLDGRTINHAFWHFYGALSDVEYWIIVRDTTNEETRTYHNQPGNICGDADTSAFLEPSDGSQGEGTLRALPLGAFEPDDSTSITSEAGACVASDTVLCLHDGRFSVEVDWSDPRREDHTGQGQTLPALSTSKTGFFWFFEPGNLELTVKLLDGRTINDRFWFFWGGLSDAEYSIRVRDTMTGAEATYRNEPYSICGGADINAF